MDSNLDHDENDLDAMIDDELYDFDWNWYDKNVRKMIDSNNGVSIE